MDRIIASIQVRMGSSRYPGKVMEEISGKPLLGHLITRVQQSKKIDDIIIATSVRPENAIIEKYCNEIGVNCFRGDEDDVLGRTLGALKYMEADLGVEVFGDCPLIDPEIIDFIITEYQENYYDYDFVGNDLKTTFPPGMEVEVFRVAALETAALATLDPKVREHGTLAIRNSPDIYRVKNIRAPKIWNRPELELEVDTEEDMYVIEQILKHFMVLGKDDYGLTDIIQFLDKEPNIKKYNQDIIRQWKQYRN
jgi:spore coat polysaccharide biosynthesis protein SpsF